MVRLGWLAVVFLAVFCTIAHPLVVYSHKAGHAHNEALRLMMTANSLIVLRALAGCLFPGEEHTGWLFYGLLAMVLPPLLMAFTAHFAP